MLRQFLLICFFLGVCFNAFSYIDIDCFFSLDREIQGVKKITQRGSHGRKTVSFFDHKGFLLRSVSYFKGKKRIDNRYEYSISDTLLIVISKRTEYQDIKHEYYSVRKYYYNDLKQCYRYECYSSSSGLEKPHVFGDNFIYKDNQLQSYEHHSESNKDYFIRTIYTYSDNQKMKHTEYVYEDSIKSYLSTIFIYKNGKLTDEILMARLNEPHIRYSNFDKHGNWRNSYFLTEKEDEILRLKRKIKYW